MLCFFFFQAEDGIRDLTVTGVQTCALPILIRMSLRRGSSAAAVKRPRSPISTQGAAPILRPFNAARSPRAMPRSARITRNQDRKSGGEGKRVGLRGGRII